MKNRISAMLIIIVALCAGITVFTSQNLNSLSDLATANIEALTQDEDLTNPEGPVQRYGCYDKYKLYTSSGTLTMVRTCDICSYQQVYKPRTKSVCPR